MLKAIRDFLLICPLLSGYDVNINYLPSQPRSFAVDSVASDPIVRKYADGGTLRQMCFAVACRDAYDADAGGNAETAKLMEGVAEWLDGCDKAGIYPEIPEGEPIKIEVTSAPSVENTAGYSARTSMRARMIYKCN